MTFKLYDNAAHTLQYAAKTNLALGNRDIALSQIKEAFQLLDLAPSRNYLQNLYNTAYDVYRVAGMPDSALYFSRKYFALHDSIEAEIAGSQLKISRIRMENERYFYALKNNTTKTQRRSC